MNLSEIEKKVLVLAMDRSAPDGEIQCAAVKLIELLRKRYPSGHELIKDLEQLPREVIRYQVKYRDNPWGSFWMPFGKYKGKKLRDVPPDYLEWLLENFDGLRDDTRNAIENYFDCVH